MTFDKVMNHTPTGIPTWSLPNMKILGTVYGAYRGVLDEYELIFHFLRHFGYLKPFHSLPRYSINYNN